MNRKKSAGILGILFQNQGILGIVLFVFFLGLSIGIFTELLLSSAERENMGAILDLYFLTDLPSGDLPSVFLRSFAINFGLLVILIIAGISVIGFPGILLVLIYKGASLGFSSTLLIETYGAKGVLMVLLTLVPQNIILIPAILIASIISLSLAFSLLAVGPKGIKKSLISCAGNFIVSYLLVAVFLLLGCFVESFIAPFLQQLLG